MKVVVLNGEMAGYEFVVSGEVIGLGRKAENDVVLPLDARISRFHAQLVRGPRASGCSSDLRAPTDFRGRRRIHARRRWRR